MNEQPKFSGPGIYSIVPYQQPDVELNSWGGGTNPGEAIKLYELRHSGGHFTDNERWQFCLVSGGGEQATYILLNVRNGYYLSVNDSGNGLGSLARTPTSEKVLFTIENAARSSNGYNVFFIRGSGGGQIYCPGGYNEGTPVGFGDGNDQDNTKFYIVTRAP